MIAALYANLKRPPRTMIEWITDAVRGFAIIGVVVAVFTLPATDAAVLSMALPAMLSRMLGLRSGLDLAVCVTVIVAAVVGVLASRARLIRRDRVAV
jgi:hypothetical protein